MSVIGKDFNGAAVYFVTASGAGTALSPYIPAHTLYDGAGTVIGASNPLQVSIANTGANATAVKVDGSAVTQPVSAVSLPLPTGASTAAKQPALGTAGTASTDVLTVQGITSMTALKTDGSGVTQPVSAASLPLPTGAAQDSTLTGGTVKAIARGGQKGTTNTNADITHTASGLNHEALDVVVYDTSGNVMGVTDNPFQVTAKITDGTHTAQISSGNELFVQANLHDGAGTNLTSVLRGSQQALSVQLVDASGNQITNFGSTSSFGSADPSGGMAAGFSDGTNMREARVFDADTGAGTQYLIGVNLRLSGNGGSVEFGTASAPIQVSLANTAANATAVKVDGSGVTQPVSGTVTANAGTGTFTVSGNVSVSGTVTANAGTGTFTNQQSNVTTDYDTGAGTQTMTMFGIALPASGGAVAGGTATNPLQVSIANTGANATAVKVDGSAVTQPISAVSLPLPSGASTSAKQPALGTAGSASADVITVQGIASMTALKVDGSGVTQPVSGTVTANAGSGTFAISAASLPLPTGASTAAKQPALGTAGSASADVITIQGIASMTAVKTDGSGVTQPVSGTVTANAGTGTFATNVAQLAGTTTDTNSGSKSAGTLRVVLATDQPQLTNSLKVDGSGVTQPVSGTVTANAGTGNFATNLAQVGGAAVALGQTTMSASVPVTLASDQGAILEKAASLVVTGSATTGGDIPIAATDVSNYTMWSLQITGTFSSHVYNFEQSNDNSNWAVCPWQTAVQNGAPQGGSTTLSAATIVTGKVICRYFRARVSSVSSGTSSCTALFTSGSNTGTTIQQSNLAAVAGSAPGTPSAPADGVSSPGSSLQTNAYSALFNGASWDRQRTPNVFKTFTATVVTNETTVWTPASGKKFRLMGMILSVGTNASNITFRDNTAGTTIFVLPKNTADVAVPVPSLGNGILSAAANNVLTAQGGGTTTISGVIFGTEE